MGVPHREEPTRYDCSAIFEMDVGNEFRQEDRFVFVRHFRSIRSCQRQVALKKLARTGLSPSWLAFIESYLAPREEVVVVEGARSAPFIIADMVFQETVLGPMLWNVFSANISTFTESIGECFADDVSIFKHFHKSMDNVDISLSFINVKNQIMNGAGTSNQPTRAKRSSLSSIIVSAWEMMFCCLV